MSETVFDMRPLGEAALGFATTLRDMMLEALKSGEATPELNQLTDKLAFDLEEIILCSMFQAPGETVFEVTYIHEKVGDDGVERAKHKMFVAARSRDEVQEQFAKQFKQTLSERFYWESIEEKRDV